MGAFACTELEMTQYDYSKAVAPVLNSVNVAETSLTEGGTFGTLAFTLADYGFSAAAKYQAFVDTNEDFSAEKSVSSSIAMGRSTEAPTIGIKSSDLNNVLVSKGISAGTETTVYFRIKSFMQGESAAVGGAQGVLVSNSLAALVTPYEAEKTYAMVWLPGTVNGWQHPRAEHLFNFAEDDNSFEGVTFFGDDPSANMFKLTGIAGWDNDGGNWGLADASAAPESKTLQLLNGSNDNITQYTAHKYYHFSFDKPSLVLTMDYGFDQLGLVGVNGDWDNDIVMLWNKEKQRFYVDVDATAETSFKVRSDASWNSALNIGGTLSEPKNGSDSNLSMDAGQWRVYVDVNKLDGIKIILNSDMYGKPETGGGGDEPSKPSVWSLIGTIGGSSWDSDIDMSNTTGDVWSVRNVALTASDEFKIRADHDWAESYGGPEENAQSTIDPSNPYGVYKPELGTAFDAKDKNIAVGVAGNYDVTFDYAAKTILVEEHKAFPEQLYMIGDEFGGWDWSSDGIVDMVPVHGKEGQFWAVRYISAGKGFKFCSKKEWSGDFWGLDTNDGFTESGGNCTVAEDGFYMVHIDLKRSMVHVEPARIYGMGDCFGGWDAEKESALFAADGKTLKATLAASGELRMFAASSISDSDWWTREFIILEGKIVYRGTGDDQTRVPCNAGQVVTLDPNAGTGTIN